MAIKSTLVTPPNKAKEIDWGKKQIVIDKAGVTVIKTSGKHDGSTFSGALLYSDMHPSDSSDFNWRKESFTPITTPITITFENE